jgi:hypothetical protein
MQYHPICITELLITSVRRTSVALRPKPYEQCPTNNAL